MRHDEFDDGSCLLLQFGPASQGLIGQSLSSRGPDGVRAEDLSRLNDQFRQRDSGLRGSRRDGCPRSGCVDDHLKPRLRCELRRLGVSDVVVLLVRAASSARGRRYYSGRGSAMSWGGRGRNGIGSAMLLASRLPAPECRRSESRNQLLLRSDHDRTSGLAGGQNTTDRDSCRGASPFGPNRRTFSDEIAATAQKVLILRPGSA
jgi:hypothetical protein